MAQIRTFFDMGSALDRKKPCHGYQNLRGLAPGYGKLRCGRETALHSPRSSGCLDMVAVQMISAPRTAASRSLTAVTQGLASAKSAADTGLRDQTENTAPVKQLA